MGESDGWIYLGEYSVQSSRYRVTIPPCVFDQYEILSRGDLAGWSYEPDINALKLWELGPESAAGFIDINKISKSGDDSPAAFITLPQGVRNEEPEQETSGEVSEGIRYPENLAFSHDQTIHFATEPGLIDGDQKAIFLLALAGLEKSLSLNSITTPCAGYTLSISHTDTDIQPVHICCVARGERLADLSVVPESPPSFPKC